MASPYIVLVVSLVLILVCSQLFVKLSSQLSTALRLSPLIIGTTLVALGTSLPELAVSLTAAANQDFPLAVGNLIGSNITNLLFVFPIAILTGRIKIGTTKTIRNTIIMLLVAAFFSLSLITHIPYPETGWLLLIGAVIFSTVEYLWGASGRRHEDAHRFSKTSQALPLTTILPLFILSVIGIFFGGRFTVLSVENISLLTGLSTGFLGLTLTAVATSLPELITTLTSQALHQDKLTEGNIIGSNVYNLLFIGGVVLLVSPRSPIAPLPLYILLACTLFFTILLLNYSGRPLPKKIAWLMLPAFLLYLLVI